MIFGALSVLIFAVVYWKALPLRLRPFALLLFGLFLFRAMATSVAINAALVLIVLILLRRGTAPWNGRAAILASVGLLAMNKYADLPAFQIVGLSYVSFRLISLTRDIDKRRFAAPTLGHGLLYALFPPTFLSGPIEPHERFDKSGAAPALSRTDLFISLARIATGLVKKLVLVAPLSAFVAETFDPSSPAFSGWAGLFAFSFVVYLDFSAYSDLAIGTARLFGYTIGENFNWPYLAASISEFWTRWHISLSQFLRDHVFLPLSGRALKQPSLARSPGLVAAGASLVTMLLCGMWHGDRLSFAAWGFGHGVLIGLHQLHRQQVIGRLPARRRMKIQAHPAYRTFATLLTFLSVTLLWVPFRFPLNESAVVYGRLFSVFFH